MVSYWSEGMARAPPLMPSSKKSAMAQAVNLALRAPASAVDTPPTDMPHRIYSRSEVMTCVFAGSDELLHGLNMHRRVLATAIDRVNW